jgi:hypothetical protein
MTPGLAPLAIKVNLPENRERSEREMRGLLAWFENTYKITKDLLGFQALLFSTTLVLRVRRHQGHILSHRTSTFVIKERQGRRILS